MFFLVSNIRDIYFYTFDSYMHRANDLFFHNVRKPLMYWIWTDVMTIFSFYTTLRWVPIPQFFGLMWYFSPLKSLVWYLIRILINKSNILPTYFPYQNLLIMYTTSFITRFTYLNIFFCNLMVYWLIFFLRIII